MNKKRYKFEFLYFRKIWITDFSWPDISFGVHWCWYGRLDIHFLKWMISFGKIPIYQNTDGNRIAVSNSYWAGENTKTLRAGVP